MAVVVKLVSATTKEGRGRREGDRKGRGEDGRNVLSGKEGWRETYEGDSILLHQ